MHLDRDFRDAETQADFLVGMTLRQQGEDFALSRRQYGRGFVAQLGVARRGDPFRSIHFSLDYAKQQTAKRLGGYRFGYENLGSRAQC